MESIWSIRKEQIPMEKSMFYWGDNMLDMGLRSLSDGSIGSIGNEHIPIEKFIFYSRESV